MADILNDPLKTVMLAIVLALEIPAVIILVVGYVKAWKENRKNKQ